MNGVRSIFRRKGYLLTALAAAVLLAASSGTALAQVTIGFVESSGTVMEDASVDLDSLIEPRKITLRVDGITSSTVVADAIGTVTISPNNGSVWMAEIGSDGNVTGAVEVDSDGDAFNVTEARFTVRNSEIVLLVAQSEDGAKDPNWLDESIQLRLSADGTAALRTNLYMLTIEDVDVAPVAKFNAPSFTLTEGSERTVSLDIVEGSRGADIPEDTILTDNGLDGPLSVRVSNHELVTLQTCPAPNDPNGRYNRKLLSIIPTPADWNVNADGAMADAAFARTGVLQTSDARSVIELADAATSGTSNKATLMLTACGDMAGFTDNQVMLTILDRSLRDTRRGSARTRGDIMKGSPVVVTLESDEAAPTLSFSPTDVTIDEGGSTSTRLIADGMNATDVGMVKLSVEGDAKVSLMHEDTMLEEMDGYVYVDLGTGNSARLTAMSHSDPYLMDGDTAYKAWKLMEGSSDANIGDDYWFRVDVVGSTAVPALPLVGQLLLALFLMAGGARLYRRRQG